MSLSLSLLVLKELWVNEGYICITYANSSLQWRECIANIFRMGGLAGIFNHYFYEPWHFVHSAGSPFISAFQVWLSACYFTETLFLLLIGLRC